MSKAFKEEAMPFIMFDENTRSKSMSSNPSIRI